MFKNQLGFICSILSVRYKKQLNEGERERELFIPCIGINFIYKSIIENILSNLFIYRMSIFHFVYITPLIIIDTFNYRVK